MIISDDILREKAVSFDGLLGFADFKASGSWIIEFKKRHSIRSVSVQGEAGCVNPGSVDEYKEHFREKLKGYGLGDAFNMDETLLFYRLLPNHTLCNKAKVSGIKNLKDRVSVVFCVSYTGEKLAPLSY